MDPVTDEGGIMAMTFEADGTVLRSRIASRTNTNGFTDPTLGGVLDRSMHWGMSFANAGDLDGDGGPEIIVASYWIEHHVPWMTTPEHNVMDGMVYLVSY